MRSGEENQMQGGEIIKGYGIIYTPVMPSSSTALRTLRKNQMYWVNSLPSLVTVPSPQIRRLATLSPHAVTQWMKSSMVWRVERRHWLMITPPSISSAKNWNRLVNSPFITTPTPPTVRVGVNQFLSASATPFSTSSPACPATCALTFFERWMSLSTISGCSFTRRSAPLGSLTASWVGYRATLSTPLRLLKEITLSLPSPKSRNTCQTETFAAAPSTSLAAPFPPQLRWFTSTLMHPSFTSFAWKFWTCVEQIWLLLPKTMIVAHVWSRARKTLRSLAADPVVLIPASVKITFL